MPPVDLRDMPPVMEDALWEAIDAKDKTVIVSRNEFRCPLLEAR